MASLFKSDVPQTDPAVAKQQKDEQARAEAARISATQDQLVQETKLRGRSAQVIRFWDPANPMKAKQ